LTPVSQTEHGPGGNCFAACLASLLDLPLASVPDLRGLPDWGIRLAAWLGPMGWACRFFPRGPAPSGWAVRHGRTLTGHVHAALCLDGALAHDPAGRPYPVSEVILWTALEQRP
jgi:hypothetical protein